MYYYRQAALPPEEYEEFAGSARIRGTPSYLELVFPPEMLPGPGGDISVVYIVPRTESSIWVCVCLDSMFSELVENFLSANDVIQPALAKGYQETWPTVDALLKNGFNGVYTEAALTVLVDEDDATAKWFVTTVVGNLPSLSIDDVLNSRTSEGMFRVIKIADACVHEFRTWRLGEIALGARVFARSVSKDLKSSAIFIRDNFDSIAKLLDLSGL